MRSIYDELVDVKDDIEPNFWQITNNSLADAIDSAFPGITYDDPDYEFVNQLKTNAKVFAAFKTHRQQNDIAAQLLDEDGNLKSFKQFKADTADIVGDYNINWLKTEYDTAVIRARMAARFKEFERDADLYPNLKWTPSTSVVKREIHVKLYGLILPITHPMWARIFPGMDWNCKCGITSTDDEPNGEAYKIEDYDTPVPPGLDGNPAFTGKIYSDSNQYRQQAYKGAKKAVKTFLKK